MRLMIVFFYGFFLRFDDSAKDIIIITSSLKVGGGRLGFLA